MPTMFQVLRLGTGQRLVRSTRGGGPTIDNATLSTGKQGGDAQRGTNVSGWGLRVLQLSGSNFRDLDQMKRLERSCLCCLLSQPCSDR